MKFNRLILIQRFPDICHFYILASHLHHPLFLFLTFFTFFTFFKASSYVTLYISLQVLLAS